MRAFLIMLLLASLAFAINGPFKHETISSDYGPRSAGSEASAFHKGIDYAQGKGTPIPAVEGGKIKNIWYQKKGGGNIIDIESGQNIWTYMHMDSSKDNTLKTEF